MKELKNADKVSYSEKFLLKIFIFKILILQVYISIQVCKLHINKKPSFSLEVTKSKISAIMRS